MNKLVNISQLAKLLNLYDKKNDKAFTYILRYWEKEFSQIKPIKIRNRRYYSTKQVDLIKMIKYMLKDKGMTIKGVKNLLKKKIITLDDKDLYSLKTDYHKNNIKIKSKTILDKIKKIKKYGKKITH